MQFSLIVKWRDIQLNLPARSGFVILNEVKNIKKKKVLKVLWKGCRRNIKMVTHFMCDVMGLRFSPIYRDCSERQI